jgi:hypothetical protein
MAISSRQLVDLHFENFQRRKNFRWVTMDHSRSHNSTHWTINHSKKVNQFLDVAETSVFECAFDRHYHIEGKSFIHEGSLSLLF